MIYKEMCGKKIPETKIMGREGVSTVAMIKGQQAQEVIINQGRVFCCCCCFKKNVSDYSILSNGISLSFFIE